MAYTTINKPSEYFNTVLYTGDGTTNQTKNITFGFQPDLSWFKSRDAGNSNILVDAVRGGTKYLISESSGGEGTLTATQLFTATGMTISNDASSANSINSSGSTKVSWGWKANGSGVSNTDGNGNNVLVSANTTAGFSIVQGDMNASGSWTFGHGLGVAPSMIILRGQTVTSNWYVYHKSLGAGTRIFLNTTDASTSDTTFMDNTTPTANVFSMNAGTWSAGAGTKMIAYCFAEKKGFSKFGSYTGSGSDLFIYTGFKPAFLICKRTNIADNWKIVDNKRSPFNVVDDTLAADSAGAEASPEGGITIDFLSNGFAFKSMSNVAFNGSGDSYIYIAFAENPLVGTNGVPATAR